MKEFDHVISLGYFCSIASELERIGLRDSSSPFDWCSSKFESVIHLIKNHFKDFLKEEDLHQEKHLPSSYCIKKYEMYLLHDFNEYQSLNSQLPDVFSKYERRIAKFYNNISERTLFLRYIKDNEELSYIENNITEIIKLLKGFNCNNEIIFIANAEIVTDKFKIYKVIKDESDVVARKFLNKNNELNELLRSALYDKEKRKANLLIYKKKQIKKMIIKLPKKIISYCRHKLCKIYIHDLLVP